MGGQISTLGQSMTDIALKLPLRKMRLEWGRIRQENASLCALFGKNSGEFDIIQVTRIPIIFIRCSVGERGGKMVDVFRDELNCIWLGWVGCLFFRAINIDGYGCIISFLFYTSFILFQKNGRGFIHSELCNFP